MKNKDKKHRVTITVSDSELDALEDSLIVWNLCKKHNAMTFDLKTGKARTSQEIFKIQDECKACQRQKKLVFRKAWSVTGRLFEARHKG
jgi:hypothetical protein